MMLIYIIINFTTVFNMTLFVNAIFNRKISMDKYLITSIYVSSAGIMGGYGLNSPLVDFVLVILLLALLRYLLELKYTQFFISTGLVAILYTFSNMIAVLFHTSYGNNIFSLWDAMALFEIAGAAFNLSLLLAAFCMKAFKTYFHVPEQVKLKSGIYTALNMLLICIITSYSLSLAQSSYIYSTDRLLVYACFVFVLLFIFSIHITVVILATSDNQYQNWD